MIFIYRLQELNILEYTDILIMKIKIFKIQMNNKNNIPHLKEGVDRNLEKYISFF